MTARETALPGVIELFPPRFTDPRGSFQELWRAGRYAEWGVPEHFAQDNVAVSTRGVLRGMHYQWPEPQGKLVQVLDGEVQDVVVDVRRGSPTFGAHITVRLSAEVGNQLWIPPGYAHGYACLSEQAVVLYKCTVPWRPDAERALRWDDPDLGIVWFPEPAAQSPLLAQGARAESPHAPNGGRSFLISPRDAEAPRLRDLDPEALPPVDALSPPLP
jgi:dTDP-4-dehydrorhamnose 3,5-epimerase